MYRLFLSFRFALRHWLMTLIGSFFVGASLIVLIVVMAVMDGFQSKLKETYAGSEADLIVRPRYPVDLGALENVLREQLGSRIVAAGPHYQTITLARRQGRIDPALQDEHHVVVVYGVDGRKEQRINRFGEYLFAGRERERLTVLDLDDPFALPDPIDAAAGYRGVILGDRLRRNIGVALGQKVRLFSLHPTETAGGGNGGNGGGQDPQQGFDLSDELFVVVGQYQSGNSDIDGRCVFIDSEAFREFFSENSAKRSVRMKLADPERFDEARDIVKANWRTIVQDSLEPGHQIPHWMLSHRHAMDIQPWWAQYENLVRAIESEKAMILTISFLIVLAGTSSIFAAQWLLVSDKTREIGILRALGAGVGGIVSIFVMNGFLMGLIGATAGTGLGYLAVQNIDAIHGFVTLITGREVFDPTIYLFTGIPTRLVWGQVIRYAVAALACTLVAAAIPAIRAGLLDPAKALHND